jgi:hypothetical protein
MNQVASGTTDLRVAAQTVKVELVAPDLSCINEIHPTSMSQKIEIGRVCFTKKNIL